MPSHASGKTVAVSASQNYGSKSPARKAEILVRVWTRNSESKRLQTDEAGADQLGAIAFIEDVIASRNGVIVPAEDDLYVSILESPSEALVVSRQIQLGMQAFQNKTVKQPVSVSISINADTQSIGTDDKQGEGDSDPVQSTATPNHDLLTLIRMSRPAQVLLTHDLFQQVSSLKGLPLKPFQGRFGVFEYLWTSEEKLLELQSQQGHFAEVIEEAAPQSNSAALADSAIDYGTNAGVPPANQSSSWRRSLQSPWTIAALVTLFFALVVAGGVSYRMKRSSAKTQANATDVASASSGSSQLSPPHPNPPATPQDTPKTAGSPPVPPVVSTNKERVPVKPEKQRQAAVKSDSGPVTSEPKKACKVPEGEIKPMLQIAEQDRVNGRYAEAKRRFSEVHDCDPNNQTAIDGLRRIAAVRN
jgi:hypothetical protein